MTVAEILADEHRRQDEFPVCRSQVFLAHAGVAPLARAAADAIGHYSFMAAQADQETWLPKILRSARESAARLLPGVIAVLAAEDMPASLKERPLPLFVPNAALTQPCMPYALVA